VIMAARPGHIIQEHIIDEPYPRTQEFMVRTEFMRHAQVLQKSLEHASESIN